MNKITLFLLVTTAVASGRVLLPDEQNNVDVYKRVSPAVVNITAVKLSRDFFFDIVPQQGMGSGAIIRADGYVLTNDHVVGNAQEVEVTMNDKTTHPARVVGRDPDSDLAIIKIDPKGKPLPVVDYGSAEPVLVGQKVLAIGNPFGLGGSLSVGVVSSVGRDIRAPSNRLIKNVLQTDAAINPGNSGGPLLDSAGRLVGVNAQIFSKSGGSEGIGFAISADTVRKILPQLIQHGQVLRPDLGMNGVGLSDGLLQALEIPLDHGVMVTELVQGGIAHKAGLKPYNREVIWGFRRIPVGGDVIYQIDSQSVSTMPDILDYIFEKKVGDTVTLHYIRGKKKATAAVKLAIPPQWRGKSL